MVLSAWYYNETSEDPREEHKYSPSRPVSLKDLEAIGVLNWHFNPKTELDKVEELRKTRNYQNKDEITISKEKLPGYEEKLKIFFTEHLHDDEEIRYIMEGSGYFDIRSKTDEWIRIRCEEGDMIVLPAGSYHRFILDNTNYLKAMRLFKADVNWTPFNRAEEKTDSHPVRLDYLKKLTVVAAQESEDEEDDGATSKLSSHPKMAAPVACLDESARIAPAAESI